MQFSNLALPAPILNAITEQGYKETTPIQAKAIPVVLKGADLMARAQTGTGKTAAFTLPLLARLSGGTPAKSNQVRALILTPTRELASQVGESVAKYGRYLPLRSATVFGGVKINPQMKKLRAGADILVATPGRLLDLYQQNAIKFHHLEVLILDEADRMLDMGFIGDIKKIIQKLPAKRQNLLFSATFSNEIQALAKSLIKSPIEISVTPKNETAKTVKQSIYVVDKNRKSDLLTRLIHDNNWDQALVFTRTKHGANKLTRHLEKEGIVAQAIHGNKSQGARTKALSNFKSGQTRILVATDIAARGLDIDLLPHVVNYDLPMVPEDYVHRIGRTGRAGKDGEAISLVSADESKAFYAIQKLINKEFKLKEYDDFNPKNTLSKKTSRPASNKPKNHHSKIKAKKSHQQNTLILKKRKAQK